MGKIYCVLLLLIAGVSCSVHDYDFEPLADYEQSEYDNNYDDDFFKEESRKIEEFLKSNENIPVNNNDADQRVQEEIKQFREEFENENAAKEEFDAIDDYQFEDNREESLEDGTDEERDDKLDKIETFLKSMESDEKGTKSVESVKTDDTGDNEKLSKEKDASADYALLWGDNEASPLLPVPIVEDDKTIFNETLELLSEADKEDNDFEDEVQAVALPAEKMSNLEEIIEETEKILAESENKYVDTMESENNDQKEELSDTNNDNSISQEVPSEEDTVDKVQEELDADLQKLFDTLNKLSEDESEEVLEKDVEDVEDGDTSNVLDYDEEGSKLNNKELSISQKVDENQDYELIDDSNLSEIFSETSKAVDEAVDESEKELEENQDNTLKGETGPDGNTKSTTDNESTFENVETITPIMYENDALVDDAHRADSSEVEEFDVLANTAKDEYDMKEEANKDDIEIVTKVVETETPTPHKVISMKMVDDLTGVEFDDLMAQFSLIHSEDLDVHSEGFSKDVAPIHITIGVDEPETVTSPNYPNPYPVDNIIDWIFEGEGRGIELNITDFAVNGAIGDYVLFKPGGIDETGHTGLVFSYRLTSERRYRFTDVDRMFVRFEAKPAMGSFLRGFKFSVRMISPLPEDLEEIPEPEPVLTPPAETLTVHLGGVTVQAFEDIKEKFRGLIADMAALYIRDNDIDPGMNYTMQITQLTSAVLCNVNWPNFNNCVEVTFGVPLAYEEGEEYRLKQSDLDAMWRKYITRDPFALMLRRMGITEFAMPDDSSVLMVWLVIAAGVLISMAMLAFALWRFSCFEDYTRMQAYSDTDSLKNEKRGLDLYPTPHQILPPLYAENDYKWTDDTRVDMGGFANKSYVRDDLYDFDSDEDVVPNRDRFTTDV